MEPEGSLLDSQGPTTGPYLEPDASSSHLHTLFPKIHPNIIFLTVTNQSCSHKEIKSKCSFLCRDAV